MQVADDDEKPEFRQTTRFWTVQNALTTFRYRQWNRHRCRWIAATRPKFVRVSSYIIKPPFPSDGGCAAASAGRSRTGDPAAARALRARLASLQSSQQPSTGGSRPSTYLRCSGVQRCPPPSLATFFRLSVSAVCGCCVTGPHPQTPIVAGPRAGSASRNSRRPALRHDQTPTASCRLPGRGCAPEALRPLSSSGSSRVAGTSCRLQLSTSAVTSALAETRPL